MISKYGVRGRVHSKSSSWARKKNMTQYKCLVAVMSDSSATPWTVAHQTPLSTGFPKQEHCSGLPFPTPGDLPDSGIKPMSPTLAGTFFTTDPLCSPPVHQSCLCFLWIWLLWLQSTISITMSIPFFLFKKIFLMWTIFKVFVEFVTLLFCFNINI